MGGLQIPQKPYTRGNFSVFGKVSVEFAESLLFNTSLPWASVSRQVVLTAKI